MRVAAGAMQQQNGVVHMTSGITVSRAQREVVQLELGQSFAAAELEIAEGDGGVFGGPVARLRRKDDRGFMLVLRPRGHACKKHRGPDNDQAGRVCREFHGAPSLFTPRANTQRGIRLAPHLKEQDRPLLSVSEYALT